MEELFGFLVEAGVIVRAFMSSIAAGSLLNLLNIHFFLLLFPIETNKPQPEIVQLQ